MVSFQRREKFPALIELNTHDYSLESRSMIITPKKLDELAYRLHANECQADLERSDNPAEAEQRKSPERFEAHRFRLINSEDSHLCILRNDAIR